MNPDDIRHALACLEYLSRVARGEEIADQEDIKDNVAVIKFVLDNIPSNPRAKHIT